MQLVLLARRLDGFLLDGFIDRLLLLVMAGLSLHARLALHDVNAHHSIGPTQLITKPAVLHLRLDHLDRQRFGDALQILILYL